MPTTLRESWNAATILQAGATLARGSVAEIEADLTNYEKALVYVCVGRGGTTALTNGVALSIRRKLVPSAEISNGAPLIGPQSGLYAAAAGTTVNAESAAGQAALNVASSSGFAAGDGIMVEAADHSRLEWGIVAKVAAGVLTLDRNLINTHTAAQADVVRNKADLWKPISLYGGGKWAIVLDYGDDSAGESVTYEVRMETCNGVLVVTT